MDEEDPSLDLEGTNLEEHLQMMEEIRAIDEAGGLLPSSLLTHITLTLVHIHKVSLVLLIALVAGVDYCMLAYKCVVS